MKPSFDKIPQFSIFDITHPYLFVKPMFFFDYLGDKFVIIAQSFYN
ncbi:hypothetical protein CZ794_12435 [Psychrobacter sp. JB385]|nr:hypothetical protein CZ794_12435 [Psychrobacter sp. JB385]